MKALLLFFSIILVFFSCKETEKRFELPPNGPLLIGFADTVDFIARVDDSLLDSVRKHLSFEYLNIASYRNDENIKIYDNHSKLALAKPYGEAWDYPYYALMIVQSSDGWIADVSMKGRTWLLDWPTGIQDTLYVDFDRDPYGPNSCNCWQPLGEATLNGRPFVENTMSFQNGVFVFDLEP